jgi:acetyl esterase/lipase
MNLLPVVFANLCVFWAATFAADPPAKSNADAKPEVPANAEVKVPAQQLPPVANVHYGEHERQVLDFWKAESSKPTPLLFHIHGGGWVAGDKALFANLDKYLAAGISRIFEFRSTLKCP